MEGAFKPKKGQHIAASTASPQPSFLLTWLIILICPSGQRSLDQEWEWQVGKEEEEEEPDP